MLGVCSTIARVGGISAPWIAVYLPDQVLNLTLDLVQPTFLGRDLSALQCLSTSSEPPLPWPDSLPLSASLSLLDRPSPTPSRLLPTSWHVMTALQDLEKMKANAKPAWKCVWPTREEE